MTQVKRAGSKLKSRIVAEQSINKWCEMIEKMEDQVASILREERFISSFNLIYLFLLFLFLLI